MTTRPWFERWPERLQHEREALRRAGIEFEVDEEAQRSGVLKLLLRTPSGHPGGQHDLRALFPDEFPFFRPEVYADSLDLPRHQNPFQKNLCLLGRSTIHWHPDTTLAEHLEKQLPLLMSRAHLSDPEILREHGEQAEPRGAFYTYQPGSFVLIDPAQKVPDELSRGTLVMGHASQGAVFAGALFRVKDEGGKPVSNAIPVPDNYAKRDAVRWVRSEIPPPFQDAKGVEDWLREQYPWVLEKSCRLSWNGGHAYVAGILYPEEVGPGQLGDGWIFLVREANGRQRIRRRYLARAAYYSEGSIFDRVKELSFLRDAHVAIAGVGCVGAPIVLELARAGTAGVRLMDGDDVEAGTTVRWPLGLEAVALPKVKVLARRVRLSYPLTDVRDIPWHIGRVHDPVHGPLDEEYPCPRHLVDYWLDGAKIIVDTTAEWGVHFFLSEEAKRRRVPYVLISGTEGGWGGELFRFIPGREDACWSCLQHWREDDESSPERRLPALAAMPEAERLVQPRGCAEPTFTGASFDLGEVALAGTRLVVMTLSDLANGGYPDVPWNYAAVSLRNEDGLAIAPDWQTVRLAPHPKCSCEP